MATRYRFTHLFRDKTEIVITPDQAIYAHLERACDLGWKMLLSDDGLRAVASAMLDFIRHTNCKPFRTLEEVRAYVLEFYGKLRRSSKTFIVVDERLVDSTETSVYHARRDNGVYPPKNVIYINAREVHNMVKKRGTDQHGLYLFKFANWVYHEVGHALVTYLGQGRENTPEHMGHPTFEGGREMGREIEVRLHGGAISWAWDGIDDIEQPGIPYLVAKDGPCRRIRSTAVWNFLNEPDGNKINYRWETRGEVRYLFGNDILVFWLEKALQQRHAPKLKKKKAKELLDPSGSGSGSGS